MTQIVSRAHETAKKNVRKTRRTAAQLILLTEQLPVPTFMIHYLKLQDPAARDHGRDRRAFLSGLHGGLAARKRTGRLYLSALAIEAGLDRARVRSGDELNDEGDGSRSQLD